MDISRRNLIKTSLAASAAAAAGITLGCKKKETAQAPAEQAPASTAQAVSTQEVDKWVKGVCRMCGTGCSIYVGVKNGKMVAIKGNVDSKTNTRGFLCIKGMNIWKVAYHPDRLTTPLIRKNGKLEPASWDEALTLIETKFKEFHKKYGYDSVAYYGSGQSSSEGSPVRSCSVAPLPSRSGQCPALGGEQALPLPVQLALLLLQALPLVPQAGNHPLHPLGHRRYLGLGLLDAALDKQIGKEAVEEVVGKDGKIPQLHVGHLVGGHVGQLGAEAAQGTAGLIGGVLGVVQTSVLGKGAHNAAPHHVPDAPALRPAQVAAHLLQGPAGGLAGLDGLLNLPQLPGGALLLLGQLAQPLGLGAPLAVQDRLLLIQQKRVCLNEPLISTPFKEVQPRPTSNTNEPLLSRHQMRNRTSARVINVDVHSHACAVNLRQSPVRERHNNRPPIQRPYVTLEIKVILVRDRTLLHREPLIILRQLPKYRLPRAADRVRLDRVNRNARHHARRRGATSRLVDHLLRSEQASTFHIEVIKQALARRPLRDQELPIRRKRERRKGGREETVRERDHRPPLPIL